MLFNQNISTIVKTYKPPDDSTSTVDNKNSGTRSQEGQSTHMPVPIKP